MNECFLMYHMKMHVLACARPRLSMYLHRFVLYRFLAHVGFEEWFTFHVFVVIYTIIIFIIAFVVLCLIHVYYKVVFI